MSRGWTIMVEMRPAERPAVLGAVSGAEDVRVLSRRGT